MLFRSIEVSKEKRKLSKDEKRRAAEDRNRVYRQLKPLKKDYDKLEISLEKALHEQAELEDKMNDPATYERPEQALKLNSAYKEVSEWAETIMEQMADLEEKMERITSESGSE